ncbi:MAG: hypothetical protein GWO00_18480 [Gemmatimonadetes bacterium]|nr:hypothetical protein [Gemmatimonadota bacterium]NIR80270.1 hypothetical protein [Gemmatimonadota bacterium]NIU32826.1 hypothetical protein [Gemmatimonadota bacterium]
MVREGAVPAVAGVAVGVSGALALGGVVRSLLFQVSPTDPLTLAAAPLLLLAVALAASWIPARRATRIQPTEALAAE